MGKSLRLLLALFLPISAFGFDYPNAFFLDEFEQGNIALWPETNVSSGCTLTIASNTVHSGKYSAKFTTPETTGLSYLNRYTIGTNYPTIYLSFRFNLESLTGMAANEYVGLARLLDVANATADTIYVKNVAGNLKLRTDKLGDGTTTLSTGQWYHVELTHTAGAGSAESTIYLNGSSEITASSLTITNARIIRVGIPYNGFGVGSSVYIDDVRFGQDRVYEPAPFIRFYAPDFRARTGNRVKVITGGRGDGDVLTCWLAGPDGYSNNWFNTITTGADLVKGSYLNAATGSYTFYALLSDSNATPRVTNSIVWEKNYAGNPTYSIDEYNRITKSGTPFFVIDAMCLHTNWSGYISSNLINSLYGQMFGVTTNDYIPRAIDYLNWASNNNLYAFIPVNGAGFTGGDGANPFMTNVINNYATNTLIINHTNLIGWDWFDEAGDENDYNAEEVRNWFTVSKELTPGLLVHANHMGITFLGPPKATGFNNNLGHSLCMPWQLADIYSADHYPIEYTNSNFAISDMPWIANNLRGWNHDTIPVAMYVSPSDVRSGLGGAPTTNELWAMCWTSIAAGANMIHWYPYQLGTPEANAITMSNFTATVTRLNNIILGLPPTTHCEWNNTNVWVKHTTSGTTNYFIAANVSSSAQTVTLSHTDIPWGRWIYWDGGSGHVTTAEDSFTDTLDGYGVKVYWLDPEPAQARSRATVVWGTP
jgi:hypothetical protein